MESIQKNVNGETLSREIQLFKSLDVNNDRHVSLGDLEAALKEVGLRADDARLSESMAALESYQEANAKLEEQRRALRIPENDFCQAIRHNILLIERALQGNMVVPDFTDFCDEVRQIYDATRANRSGKPANYIPQLDLKEPESDQFGVALCTIDGQLAAEGRLDVVRYLLAQGIDPSPRDRWGYTPLDEALRHDQHEVADLLKKETEAHSEIVSIG